MSALLIQDNTGSVQLYLETSGGSPAIGLAPTDVSIGLKKATSAFFVPKALTGDTLSTRAIGSGVNGTVIIGVPGTPGDSYQAEVVLPGGTSPLSVTKVATVLTVTLSTVTGAPVSGDNTATKIAAAINALGTEVQATASGTGADPLTGAEALASLTGGVDGDWTDLGAGFYELDLAATDTDVLGSLAIRVQGIAIRSAMRTATIIASAVTATSTPVASLPTTLIYGYIYNVSSAGVANASVTFHTLSVPTVLHPGFEGVGVSTDRTTVQTDASGYFSTYLLSGAAISVYIPAVNYKRTFIVPSADTNLFDLP